MTMCPSILASICAPPPPHTRESGKLRGLKCAQSVPQQRAQCRVREYCNQRTPCATASRRSSCPGANINCEAGSAKLIGRSCESYQCICPMCPYTTQHRSYNGKQMHLILVCVAVRWSLLLSDADTLLTALWWFILSTGRQNIHRLESELDFKGLDLLKDENHLFIFISFHRFRKNS